MVARSVFYELFSDWYQWRTAERLLEGSLLKNQGKGGVSISDNCPMSQRAYTLPGGLREDDKLFV